MIKLGVTGGIGSGKSMVCAVFSALGVPVFNADLSARNMVDTDEQLKKQIADLLGKDVYGDDGKLQRKKVADIVFTQPEKLQALNALIHPAVARAFADFCNKHTDAHLLVKEAAILIESGAYKEMDAIVLVTAPAAQRVARVMKRDGITEDEVMKRMKNQWPEEKLKTFAHYIIENSDGTMLLPQVLDVYNKVK